MFKAANSWMLPKYCHQELELCGLLHCGEITNLLKDIYLKNHKDRSSVDSRKVAEMHCDESYLDCTEDPWECDPSP